MTDSDWGRRWEDFGKRSFLKQTQQDHPEKWRDFYDRVAGLWEQMAGLSFGAAKVMAGTLADQGFAPAGNSVLEIGCGPGNLSLALAAYGCRVTAMDQSLGMIRVLKDKIRATGSSNVVPLAADWSTLDAVRNHDLAIAAFFPEACCPQGVSRMEKLAKHACVLVVGNGSPAFPFHRQIWKKVMDAPCPVAGDHLTCAQNFLEQTGRAPIVLSLDLPVVLDVSFLRAREYFTAYFSMFRCPLALLNKTIDQVLAPHAKNGHIYFEGQFAVVMVCWDVPADSSLSGG
ncbi:class I SAM-dependent methyltransferase [uncultured Desulfobacter sp.]|uniref:class I SAM-dependent methyltransferase n=1 Tax=uncultured Desulfobacter sp. TaxID=240139 RepID=UPI0029F59E8B|nr:class I SAM-dependent methyltransferase [uncultured Desulfobacter sp.]